MLMHTMRRLMKLFESVPGFPEVTRELAVNVIDACHRFGFEIDPPENEENDEDFDEDEALEAAVESRLYGILDEISVYQENGKLTIYRAIAVRAANDLVTKHLGIYWSTTRGNAQTYGASDALPWLRITAAVDIANLDWVTTLALHMEGGEDEVRLESGVPVEILAVDWITPGQRSLKRLVGRTLYT
jgi:hypothetical protein